MSGLNIIQYNCGNANGRATRPFFDSLDPREFPIIAVQEPMITEAMGTTYCPKNYRLSRAVQPGVRVVFMMHEAIELTKWRGIEATDNVEWIQIDTEGGTVNLVNVYAPPVARQQPRIAKWEEIKRVLERVEGSLLLMGDFNAHHPEWAGQHRDREPKAEHLLLQTQGYSLCLLNEPGVATWRRGESEEVIDLAFATPEIAERVMAYRPRDDWALTKDHIPIEMRLDLGVPARRRSERFAIKKANWEKIAEAVQPTAWANGSPHEAARNLQRVMGEALEKYCPKANPSDWARPEWSPKAAELLAGARQSRREYQRTGCRESEKQWKRQRNQLQQEMRRNGRTRWRKLVEELTDEAGHQGHPHNRGLWRLSRWSRRERGQRLGPTILPALRETDATPLVDAEDAKAEVLRGKFFPESGQADLSDVSDAGSCDFSRFQMDATVSSEELRDVISGLPNGKAPGPDQIPNEAWKKVEGEIVDDLAAVITGILRSGWLPESFKESTTVVLRKEKKKDYSLPGSYRPIALENTIAKIVEKVLARRITTEAEQRGLLSWNQMGARKARSTLSALELLTGCIQTAWTAKKKIVSVLGLDLAGAFDNVSHDRLLWVLRQKGYDEWVVQMVMSFLKGRRTRITFGDYTSRWYNTETGIPQGSTLSPVLFLFFMSQLLEQFQEVKDSVLGFGFVDDTTLVCWGDSAVENCSRLQTAYQKCEEWARRFGARFAPEKFQVIHFTKQKKVTEDLKATVKVQGQDAELVQSLRVLGVWLDPALSWKDHIRRAVEKGQAAFRAMARVTASTWGPSVRRSRLLYSAIARPAMLYGAQVWSVQGQEQEQGRTIPEGKIAGLQVVQNSCLRRVTGAYKRTPVVALERESGTPPVGLYIESVAMQRAVVTAQHPVTKEITSRLDDVWKAAFGAKRRRGRPSRQPKEPPPPPPRPRVGMEALRERAKGVIKDWEEKERERAREEGQQGQGQKKKKRRKRGQALQHQSHIQAVDGVFSEAWRRRWEREAQKRGREAAIWKGGWEMRPAHLYDDLPKHLATAAFLLRSEVLGLRGWLAAIGVPGVDPACSCGARRQTLTHVLSFCPDLAIPRLRLMEKAGTTSLRQLVGEKSALRHAARWLLDTGLLEHLEVAKGIEKEDIRGWAPFQITQQ